MQQLPPMVQYGFPFITSLMAIRFVTFIVRSGGALGEPRDVTMRKAALGALGLGLWMGLFAWLAKSGVLAQFEQTPPPLNVTLVVVVAAGLALGFSPLGERLVKGLPLHLLVSFHIYRFPLELMMHKAAEVGLMPEQMSYTGYNFDIATGVSAIFLAWALDKRSVPLRVVEVWNGLGFGLLMVIGVVSLLSTPMFAVFGSEPEKLNTWIAQFPYVWLPSVLVPFAIFGHVLLWRKLRLERAQQGS